MIVVIVGLFRKLEPGQFKTHLVSHICYDAESIDDAKRDFLVTDACLKALNDGYELQLIHVQVANLHAVIAACEEAAKASFNLIMEAATKAQKEVDQEGEDA